MRKCGLLGEKLGHSYSPEIHALLGDYEYELYEKTPAEAEVFLRHGEFDGLNVTIPYKKTAAALCTELSPAARKLGSVNTIAVRTAEDGSRILYGDNTDYAGRYLPQRRRQLRESAETRRCGTHRQHDACGHVSRQRRKTPGSEGFSPSEGFVRHRL